MGHRYLLIMNYPKDVKVGDVISAKWLNGLRYYIEELHREIVKCRLQSGQGYRASYGAGGTTIQLDNKSKMYQREDPTKREFQIKFDPGEGFDKLTKANPKDCFKIVVFWGRIFNKSFDSVDVGDPEKWNEIKEVSSDEADIYVYFKTDKTGNVTEAEFGTEEKINIPYIKDIMGGEYCVKLGSVKDGVITQLLQGPIEFFGQEDSDSGDKSKNGIHEFKISVSKEDDVDKDDGNTPEPPSEGEATPPKLAGNKEVRVWGGRIIKADYSETPVGEDNWNSVPGSNSDNCKIYVHFNVDMESNISNAEFSTESREIKEFKAHDVIYSGGQNGEYCILVGEIIDGVVRQKLHGPIPFLSRVGRTDNALTAFKDVNGQFLDFWPLMGSNGIEVDLQKEEDKETEIIKFLGILFKLKLVADNAGIIINDPAKKEGHLDHIGLEVVLTTPFAVVQKKEKGPPLFPEEEVSWKYTTTVKANMGSVAYFDGDDQDTLKIWRAEDTVIDDLNDGYVILECNLANKTFEIKTSYRPPVRWESDDQGKPLYSRCALAKIFGGDVWQLTHSSFILSPMFIGDKAVLDLAPYASLDE